MTRATGFTATATMMPATALATAALAAAGATMLRTTTGILVRLVFARLAAFRAGRVRALRDLEFGRRGELDRALEQLLDVLEQRHFIR